MPLRFAVAGYYGKHFRPWSRDAISQQVIMGDAKMSQGCKNTESEKTLHVRWLNMWISETNIPALPKALGMSNVIVLNGFVRLHKLTRALEWGRIYPPIFLDISKPAALRAAVYANMFKL